MDIEKADHIKCEPEDFISRYENGWHIVETRDIPNWRRFVTEEQANKWINGMCNPREAPARLYKDYCRCGALLCDWEYVRTENLVYELCKKCKNPLRADIASRFRREAVADFDIFAFISGVP